MSQTKRSSFKEACTNTFIGFVITLLFSPLIYALCGIHTSPSQLGLATFYFTIISVARSYIIRRFFNGLKPRKKKEVIPECCFYGGHSYVKISNGRVCHFCGDMEGKF